MKAAPASVGVRAIARFADVVLVMVPAYLLLAPLILAVLPDARATTWVALGAAWLVVVMYETAFIAAIGQTIGKRALGLRVVAVGTGGIPTRGAAFARALVPSILLVVGVGVGWFVPYAWALFQRERRGLHDLIAGTAVVQLEIG